jgi:hypothetical protein
MRQNHKIKFLVMRYVPNVVVDAHVNFAVLGHEVETGDFVEARFLPDWRPVIRLDPDVDVELLDCLKTEIQEGWSNTEQRETMLRMFLDSFSNSIQVSGEQGCLTDDPKGEMNNQALRYLGTA